MFWCRLTKKLPTTSCEVTIVDILCGLLRMRNDRGCQDTSSSYHSFLKRLVHSWAQRVEQCLEARLMTSCPDPVVGARVHPFMKSARLKGNKSLEMSLVQRFTARGGGFITLKDTTVSKLGLVPANSSLASRTSNEFTTRMLLKTAEFMKDATDRSSVINFCFDAAFVSEEHVPMALLQRPFQVIYVCSLDLLVFN